MTEERFIFQQPVEGLARALGTLLDDPTRERFKALGINFDKLDPAFSQDVWAKAVTLVGQLLAPGGTETEQLHRCGRRFVEGYGHTLVGQALLAMMRVLGPRRTLQRMHRNFRSGNNYTEVTLTEVAGGAFQMWISPVHHTDWYRGVVEAGLEAAGARNVKVEQVSRVGEAVTFRIEWA